MTKRATLLACVVVNGLLTVGVLQYVSAHGGSPGIAFVEAIQACLVALILIVVIFRVFKD